MSELSSAIQQIAEEKNLSLDDITETIELALAAAFRKDFGNKQQNLFVEFDINTGSSRVFDIKTVVDDELVVRYEKEQEEKERLRELAEESGATEPPASQTIEAKPEGAAEDEDEEEKFNPKTMIGLSAAKEIQADIELEAELKQELEVPSDYGRMAAQTAKQVIIQKIREAEREKTFASFKEKEHELLTGMVQRVEPKVVLIDMDGATALMPISEQISNERYRIGNRFKFYLREVKQTPKGPEIIVSRAHPEMLRKLFAVEVPEVSTGAVVIKSIAREAGDRSKLAVMAKESNIDPIGSCVGQRGARVQTIINELGGEKIDIIEYAEEPTEFIANSLSPAKVLRVETEDEQRLARAFVKNDQLSLAIGRGGQNVRLAAKLTGWRIDIVDEDSGEVKESAVETDEQTKETSVETEKFPPEADQPLAESNEEIKADGEQKTTETEAQKSTDVAEEEKEAEPTTETANEVGSEKEVEAAPAEDAIEPQEAVDETEPAEPKEDAEKEKVEDDSSDTENDIEASLQTEEGESETK